MTEPRWEYQDRLATAFDEVKVLEQMGDEGWELIDVGLLVLHVRRPEGAGRRTRWDYLRLMEFGNASQRARVERDGWRRVDTWGPLHDYARERSEA